MCDTVTGECREPNCPEATPVKDSSGCGMCVNKWHNKLNELLVNGLVSDGTVAYPPTDYEFIGGEYKYVGMEKTSAMFQFLLMSYTMATITHKEYERDYTTVPGTPGRKWDEFVADLGVSFNKDVDYVEFKTTTELVPRGELVATMFFPLLLNTYVKVNHKKLDLKGTVLATDTDVYVEWRGSEGLTTPEYLGLDFLTALQPYQPTPDSADPTITVHSGQYSAFMKVAPLLWEKVAAAFAGNPGVTRIWFLGHSLGGASAIMTAAIFKSQFEYAKDYNHADGDINLRQLPNDLEVAGVITYGAYQVGNAAFAQYYKDTLKLHDKTIRWVMHYDGERDFVSRCPGSNVCGYTHVGVRWDVKWDGTTASCLPFTDGPDTTLIVRPPEGYSWDDLKLCENNYIKEPLYVIEGRHTC